MLESQKIELRRSKIRERLGEITQLSGDDYSDEIRTEESGLQDELTSSEQRMRSAKLSEDDGSLSRRARPRSAAVSMPSSASVSICGPRRH